ncbi:MAG: hypothetical protein ABIF82_06315 [Planctomycetota bacterium]
MSIARRLYTMLPPSLKDVAASLYGCRLARLRYGKETPELVRAMREREAWEPEQWRRFQGEALRRLVRHASRCVPYYRDAWAKARIDVESVENVRDIEKLPFTEKKDVRERNSEFLNERMKKSAFHPEHTSGTTGTPLDLWWTKATCRLWYAFFEARIRNWAGVRWGDRWAMLGGQLVVPVTRTRPPFWVWNAPFRQLYMSAYHLKDEFIPYYLDELERRQVTYLYGYASCLYQLARHAISANRKLTFKAAFSNAEPLCTTHRQAIAEAFNCTVRDTYSGAEIVCLASECDSGNLHVSPDVGLVEIVNDLGERCEAGEVGEIVSTGFVNVNMPLIRYKTGDRAALSDDKCPCGRSMPVLQSLEGRKDDVLYTTDGRPVGSAALSLVFKTQLPIKLAQVEQKALGRIIIRIVPDAGYSEQTEVGIAEKLRERLGPVDVTFEKADDIPRGPGGKFRAVISRLPPASRPI